MTEIATPRRSATDRGGLDPGVYEVLRARLSEQAAELVRRAGALDARRREAFGAAVLRHVGTERIRTRNDCVPRDVVPVGGVVLFGCNVPAGREPTTVSDVFSLHRLTRELLPGQATVGTGDVPALRFDDVHPGGIPGLLDDPAFERDFGDLYRYYRDTRLLQLRCVGATLLAVFQTGRREQDIRVLRWRIGLDGSVSYLDNRGERDHAFPAPHDLEWVAATRDDHRPGRHPHISIQDELFVGTVGGSLTVKVEDDTETGDGVYREPVDEPLQSLADAEVYHARVGPLILLRIRPYKETTWRHLVFSTRTAKVVRLDGIGQACRRLPADQGIIFPGGYCLASGVARTFDTDTSDLEFERVIRSAGGEDVLHVFHARAEGRFLLLPYNMIRTEVAAPIVCHGYCLFDDGTLVLFRAASEDPGRVHAMQVWQTPYLSDAHAHAAATGTATATAATVAVTTAAVGSGPLERVGNAELVRGISECLAVARLADGMSPSRAQFGALIGACGRAFDRYHWLGAVDLGDLHSPLAALRDVAEQVSAEFETVRALTETAQAAVTDAATRIGELLRRGGDEPPGTAAACVQALTELRQAQGHLGSLRDIRYVDLDRIDALAADVTSGLAAAAGRAVTFLHGDGAFAGYREAIDRSAADAAGIATAAAAGPVETELAELSAGLETVAEVVAGLDGADTVARTHILEQVGELLGGVNRARAILTARRGQVLAAEGRAVFAAEFALLGQAITTALAVADTPERCDGQLGRLLVSLESLESRFGEFDEFRAELAARRADVHDTFAARRQALLHQRTSRADRRAEAAGRILDSVRRRCADLSSLDEVNAYFAADPMVATLRGIADELRSLGDQIRADELAGRLESASHQARQALRDRADLCADGDTIRLGGHRFAVSTQPVDLALVPHEGGLAFAITGTDYRCPVRDDDFEVTRPFWEQPLVSESGQVYRAEYLAAGILADAEAAGGGLSLTALAEAADREGNLLALVRRAAGPRYDEGYARGVHDQDAARILAVLVRLRVGAGLLRYPPAARAAAQVFWAFGTDESLRPAWSRRAASLSRARAVLHARGLPSSSDLSAGPSQSALHLAPVGDLCAELADAASVFLTGAGLTDLAGGAELAGEYLFEELADHSTGFVTSASARGLLARFRRTLDGLGAGAGFGDDLRAFEGDLAVRHQLVQAWLTSVLAARGEAAGADPAAAAADPADLPEAAAILTCGARLARHDSSASLSVELGGLLGAHPRVVAGRLEVRLDETVTRIRRFRTERVPAYRAYQRRREELISRERRRLRLEEYRPTVAGGFVRNRLIDEVYLPLVATNLARQLGTAGEGGAPDQTGLLLLISPPGYGKTMLMEYVASRLGLVLVKVDGPTLGDEVTSLDPAAAPDSAARQEIAKVSFALEMGAGVLLYLDDIQHTSPRLLEKFIPLCDAQRRMDGVWDGQARTYDLRGKRFAVCMAGNPYTESGGRFRVPDMLANRADVWNFGDVLSGREELFALSYIENALTSNPVLAPLAGRDPADVETLTRLVQGDRGVRPDRLRHPYPPAELEQILAVLRRLLRVQRVVMAVNRAYIASAAQDDGSRTEPPFQLQGSYRNMNRLAERIIPVMNDDEVDALIDDHYLAEAQTLAGGAEANLLKLAELRGSMTPAQAARWAELKARHRRAVSQHQHGGTTCAGSSVRSA